MGGSAAGARTLGPWSSAVALVNAREAALEQRLKRKQGGGGEEGAPPKRASVAWTPSRDARLGPRCASWGGPQEGEVVENSQGRV